MLFGLLTCKQSSEAYSIKNVTNVANVSSVWTGNVSSYVGNLTDCYELKKV
jgi:hypothetical protein